MELTDGICEEYLEYIKSKCELSTNPLEKQLRISPIEIDGKTFEFSSDEAKNAEVLSDAMIAILQSDKFHLYRQNRAKPKINDEAPKVDSEKLPNKHKDNSNGKNKWNWWKLALLALAIALVIPLALYFFLKLPFGFDNIKPDTVESLWLLFWGDFIGAIASFLVVYQAYSDNKRFSKESELTRQQVATQSDIQILRDKYDRLEKIVIEANEIYSYRLLMKIYDEIDLYQGCYAPKTLKQPQYVEKVRSKALSLVCNNLSKIENLSLLLFRFSDDTFVYQKFGGILYLSNTAQFDTLTHLKNQLNDSSTDSVDKIIIAVRNALFSYGTFHDNCDKALSYLSMKLLEEKSAEIRRKQSQLHLHA